MATNEQVEDAEAVDVTWGHLIEVRDGEAYSTCDECGSEVHLFDDWPGWRIESLQGIIDSETGNAGVRYNGFIQVEGGFCFSRAGGYAMFTDEPDGVGGPWVVLCHDCTLKLFRTLPVAMGGGGDGSLHPYKAGEEPCCEFGWSLEAAARDAFGL